MAVSHRACVVAPGGYGDPAVWSANVRKASMSEASAETPAATFSHRDILTVFSGVALAMLMAAIDQTIVATALPTMAEQLGNLDLASWVVSAYLLTATATAPIYGKLSDLFGRKRVLETAILFFLAGSVLCAAAQTMTQLVIFRAIQGLGGGGLMVLAFTIIADVVSPRERGRYQGLIGGVFALASVVGPLLGGFFTEHLSWHWIFLINLPVGMAALVMTGRALKRLPRGRARPRVDVAGALLLMAAVSCLLLLVSNGGVRLPWTSLPIVGLAVGGALLTAAFVWHERRTVEPILPMGLFRVRVFSVAVSVVAVSAMVLFGGIVFLPLHLQLVQQTGATASGLLLLPMVLGMTIGAVGGGRLIARTGRYKIFPLAGLALSAVMYTILGFASHMVGGALGSSLILVPLGIGLGLVMPVMTVAVQNAVDHRDMGAATASVGFFRSLGGMAGVALFGAALAADVSARLAQAGLPGLDPRAVMERGSAVIGTLPVPVQASVLGAFEAGFETTYFMAAGLAVVSFVLTLFLPELPLRTTPGKKDVVEE